MYACHAARRPTRSIEYRTYAVPRANSYSIACYCTGTESWSRTVLLQNSHTLRASSRPENPTNSTKIRTRSQAITITVVYCGLRSTHPPHSERDTRFQMNGTRIVVVASFVSLRTFLRPSVSDFDLRLR